MTTPEQYYIKKPNGRYQSVGYGRTPDLHPGLWLIQEKEHGKRHTNMFYRMNDVPDMVEVQDMARCTMLADLISDAIVGWGDSGVSKSPSDIGRDIAIEVYKKLQLDRAEITKLMEHLDK
jgi:hypothetical protein